MGLGEKQCCRWSLGSRQCVQTQKVFADILKDTTHKSSLLYKWDLRKLLITSKSAKELTDAFSHSQTSFLLHFLPIMLSLYILQLFLCQRGIKCRLSTELLTHLTDESNPGSCSCLGNLLLHTQRRRAVSGLCRPCCSFLWVQHSCPAQLAPRTTNTLHCL